MKERSTTESVKYEVSNAKVSNAKNDNYVLYPPRLEHLRRVNHQRDDNRSGEEHKRHAEVEHPASSVPAPPSRELLILVGHQRCGLHYNIFDRAARCVHSQLAEGAPQRKWCSVTNPSALVRGRKDSPNHTAEGRTQRVLSITSQSFRRRRA